MAIRNVFGLWLGQTSKGDKCMKSTLRKRLIIEDPESGKQSVYEPGTTVMILRDKRRKSDRAPEYQLIAFTDDEETT